MKEHDKEKKKKEDTRTKAQTRRGKISQRIGIW